MEQQDHDLLIILNSTITEKFIILSEKIDKIDDKFDKSRELCDECERSIYNEIGKVSDKKLDGRTAYWLWGIYFTAGAILVAFVADHGMCVSEHSVSIQHIMTTMTDLMARCKG